MKKNLITIILYLHLLSLICSIIFIYYFEKKLGSDLITCAENQVRQLMNITMNKSINTHTKNIEFKYLINTEYNNQKEITIIEYNTKEINTIKNKITKELEKDIINMTTKKITNTITNTDISYQYINNNIIFLIPIGSSTGNYLLSNIGPKIPIKLKLIGEISTDIKSKIKEYGMNNALIEIDLISSATLNIQMPFLSKKIKVTNTTPLTIQMIQGKIPEYYLDNTKR